MWAIMHLRMRTHACLHARTVSLNLHISYNADIYCIFFSNITCDTVSLICVGVLNVKANLADCVTAKKNSRKLVTMYLYFTGDDGHIINSMKAVMMHIALIGSFDVMVRFGFEKVKNAVRALISLRPSDAYIRQWTNHHWFRQWLIAGSAPSHYLNQCWNIVNWTNRNKLQWSGNRNSYIFIQENTLENIFWKMAAILSRSQCVKTCLFF